MTNNQTHSPTEGGHLFTTLSTHSTSDGRVAYRRCDCGLWRIERSPTRGPGLLEAEVDQWARTAAQHRGPNVDGCVRTRALTTGCKA